MIVNFKVYVEFCSNVHEANIVEDLSEELIQEIKKIPNALSMDQLTILNSTKEEPLEC